MDSDDNITIESKDGKKVVIAKKAALRSGVIKGLLEDYPENTEFPLNQINGNTLEKIKEYLIHYQESEPEKIQIPLKSLNFNECVPEWDFNYLGEDVDMIFDLLHASNYMDIKSLFELTSAKLGSKIKGMTSQQVKNDFEIPELTPEESEQVMNDKKFLEDNL